MRSLAQLSLAILMIVGIVSCAPPCWADLIVNAQAGTTYQTPTLAQFGTQGDDMVGITVSVTFDDFTSETVSWIRTGNGRGGAFGSGWEIRQGRGSTWSNPFQLQNSSGKNVVEFSMHGAPANTVFDRSFNGEGTPTSANGRDIFEFGTNVSSSQDLIATYYDLVQLNDLAPVGDLYGGLRVNFSAGLQNGGQFWFITDTDSAISAIVTPEPSSLMLCTVFLTSLTRHRSRRQRS